MRLGHLGLAVRDQQRSRRFYERYFGFDAGPAQVYEDGVLFLRDGHGFDLALADSRTVPAMPGFFHFGFRVGAPDAVRLLRARLATGGVEILEHSAEPAYESFKCRDPDGYVVEVYWEPGSPDPPPAAPTSSSRPR
jgi:catechol 2,3-dioxygenase-like lactoylglutathione lyase family enzyme